MKPTWVILFFIPIIQHSQAWRHWKRPVCDPVKCEPNCREVSNPKGCPTCLCEKVPECAVPKCEPGCKVETEFNGPCPGCDCEEEIKVIAEKFLCAPVQCTAPCREINDLDGCPSCLCDPPCSPPKCDPGCEIEIVFEGPCPGCKCEYDIGISVIAEKPLCAPVKCTAPCREINDLDGCPSCLCDPLCSPPKCDPGCEIETVFEGPCPGCKCEDDIGISDGVKLELKKPMCDPPLCPPGCVIETVFEGPCPGCKCEEKDEVKLIPRDDPQCSPPLCPPGCELEWGKGPCPGCKCDRKGKDGGGGELKPGDIACSPPKCDPGCEIEIEFEGPCPGCKCEIKDEVPLCSPPKCDPGCEVEKEFDGPCPGCKCELKEEIVPLCSPPKCDPGCEVEKEFDGPCPGCKCELKEEIEVETEDVCPPLLDCGKSCKVEKDEKGCEKCVCEPECGIPLCQEGCFLKKRPSQPCPSCHCPRRWSKHG